MRITEFQFESTQKGWRLKPVVFSDLTLLVGLSGVGKTRILRSLSTLVVIAQGKSRPGIKWLVHFVDESARQCVWAGEFEKLDDGENLPDHFEFMNVDEDDGDKKRAKIISESLVVDGRLVIDRKNEQISLLGDRVPKLSPHESAVSLFKEEDEIKPVSKSFERIVF